MIYDLFVNYVIGDSEEAFELLANSRSLQYALSCGATVTAIAFIVLVLYAFLVLFRGWK